MEDRIETSLLLDYYKSLLTDKQNDVMSMYFDENLSLGEIADVNETSRQAIFDLIHRTHKKLLNYEEKLHMKKDFEKKEAIKSQLKVKITNLNIDEDSRLKIMSLIEDI